MGRCSIQRHNDWKASWTKGANNGQLVLLFSRDFSTFTGSRANYPNPESRQWYHDLRGTRIR